ncbi:class III lanthionine synthetase LanKC [Dactylosporangium sp. NPDC051485]|uniref:class III lanthionine synthetase LanKC n=1 Tax=Dactylosporangium sp. NPDC051485 TaxID=3154846 RepID=UPI00342DC745
MREERWVNRFFYAWNDTLFYDPLEVAYRPRRDHFLTGLDEQVRARFERAGIWWSHRHDPDLPAQGWKIHVSATRHNVHDVATRVLTYLAGRDIDCKVALDLNIFEMLNSKGMHRGSSGKLITVYPHDEDEFRSCVAGLAELLGDAEGAYILSDVRYRAHKALYFRYGQFLDTHTIDALGRKVPHIVGPDGRVPDERRAGFAVPWDLPWPFADWKPDEDESGPDLLGGRFRVVEAIQFSNSGGVYVAEDTADNDRVVVVKEARPHTNPNPRYDHDAVDILRHEWSFLRRLEGTGHFPAAIAEFTQWEHHFFAMEHVEAADIRELLFEHNPLVHPAVEAEAATGFLRVYLAIFDSFTRAIRAAHQRGVILGDLNATNLLVDPETFHVTIIDLESCRLVGAADGGDAMLGTVELFTPGFSHSRRADGAPELAGDLYSLAAIMAYLIFPIAAMSFLRDDVFELFRRYVDRLGWPPRLHGLLLDLAEARVTLDEVLASLESLRGATAAPNPPRPLDAEGEAGLAAARDGVAAFVTAVADPERATLFPADPFAHVTNPLSLGLGAAGVLWALQESGVEVRPQWRDWLRERIEGLDPAEYPPGLMTGLAGIAWAADGLGLREQARDLLRRAEPGEDYTFYYGLSGIGTTRLRFYLRQRREADLAAARACADALHDTVERDGELAFWRNGYAVDGPLTGLGFGQAGAALFLLRMHQVTGEDTHLRLGRRALAWEMANARPWGDALTFEHEGTLFPYVEVGSAGVAQVLLRYGDEEAARTVLRGLDIDCSALPGYAFGMSGIADALLDAHAFLGDPSYRAIALRQLDYVRKVFLFTPPARFGLPAGGIAPLAVPGEGLLRCSCDLMTGSAGVLRVLHRATTGGPADFLLDEAA